MPGLRRVKALAATKERGNSKKAERWRKKAEKREPGQPKIPREGPRKEAGIYTKKKNDEKELKRSLTVEKVKPRGLERIQ